MSLSESHASGTSRSDRLDRALAALLQQAREIEAAAVVSFDGLPMASALPASMDEDRVAAMSAALLSLGERAAQGLGRGELSQVYIEGETGTVFLVSADNEAVLVAVAQQGAKVGMMLYEVRRAAAAVAEALRADDAEQAPVGVSQQPTEEPVLQAVPQPEPVLAAVPNPPTVPERPAYVSPLDSSWGSSYASGSSSAPSGSGSPTWS
ncbi:MAG TPA: roadblock/LC7 domain-containing protein [Mycobacteriales bacterium]|nr:roadblock/LC7 domain-containing protein [Mycobacteriales bacterium]